MVSFRAGDAVRRCGGLADETARRGFSTVCSPCCAGPQDAPDAFRPCRGKTEIRVGAEPFRAGAHRCEIREQGVFETEKQASEKAFYSASRSKRSKIGSFVTVVPPSGWHPAIPATLEAVWAGAGQGRSRLMMILAPGPLHATPCAIPLLMLCAEQAVIEQACKPGKKTPKRSFETDD